MTAPLTPPPPPHQPPSDDAHAWQAPPAGGVAGTVEYEQDGPGMKTEVKEAAVVTVAVALAGVLLGVLWWWLAPHVPLVADDSAVYLKDTEGEQAIGVDGTFTLLALAFGAVSAVVVFLVRRRGGVPLVVALAVGGVLGSLLAWRIGIWLGPTQNVVAHAKAVGKGVTFSAPLKLGAKGALLAWSLAGLVVHLGLTALFGPRDPDPYASPYGAPPAPPAV
ncbi:AAA family ATPase [Streptomyces sp. NPDC059837]|uniref:AAA family ATPase n=1 Tax=unclassified Streptomyces TaxID=2593676 RepID=UPI002254929F|nr:MULTISPECIES: AAA family ATPase [unclassified Streptomyces]MCX4401345.1 AAA family ATPase [Streptomyces sp. NBC_01764]MCX5089650.1 AAA family ATPase [Streptomyces sp. NBC_00365]MCX5183996.1 AAA family ATPase [Streptomyces sp. NBC_00268]